MHRATLRKRLRLACSSSASPQSPHRSSPAYTSSRQDALQYATTFLTLLCGDGDYKRLFHHRQPFACKSCDGTAIAGITSSSCPVSCLVVGKSLLMPEIMASFRVAALLLLSVSTVTLVVALPQANEELQPCGEARYYASKVC